MMMIIVCACLHHSRSQNHFVQKYGAVLSLGLSPCECVCVCVCLCVCKSVCVWPWNNFVLEYEAVVSLGLSQFVPVCIFFFFFFSPLKSLLVTIHFVHTCWGGGYMCWCLPCVCGWERGGGYVCWMYAVYVSHICCVCKHAFIREFSCGCTVCIFQQLLCNWCQFFFHGTKLFYCGNFLFYFFFFFTVQC